MPGFPGVGPWPAIRQDLERPRRRPVVAVVAFIGVDAPAVMPLRPDDTLVCDASPLAIRRGLTSVAALRTYRRRGVQIFSLSGLHAKVIASPTSAWVGSANASKNSEKNLLEAGVRITGSQARAMYRWACSLATDDIEQSARDLRTLAALPVDRFRPSPVLDRVPLELPDSLPYLWAVETGERLSATEKRAVASDRAAAKAAASKTSTVSALEFVLIDPTTPAMKPGDWMIDVRNGHVRNPARVVRVQPLARDHIIWHAPVPAARPTVAALRDLEPDLCDGFQHLRIRGPKRANAVLDLFR